MVMAIVGHLGAGKSYTLAELGLRYMSEGYKVYSLTPDIVYADVVKIDDVPNLISSAADGVQDSVLLMDEAGLLLFSRSWANPQVSPLIQFVITSRKRGFHIIYTAQYKTMVDKVLREVTTDVIYCMRLPFGFFLRYYVNSLDLEIARYNPAIFGLYDTTSGYRKGLDTFAGRVDYALQRLCRRLTARSLSGGRLIRARIVGGVND